MTTTEEAIRLATAAGFPMYITRDLHKTGIKLLIELAKEEENEACAKLCESLEAKADALNDSIEDSEEWRSDYVIGKAQAANAIAKAIRERMKL